MSRLAVALPALSVLAFGLLGARDKQHGAEGRPCRIFFGSATHSVLLPAPATGAELEAAGVIVDRFAGSSMGAVIAGLGACPAVWTLLVWMCKFTSISCA